MNTPSQAQVRRAIAEAQTIVVKVGSSSLTEPSGHLDPPRLNALVAAIARVRLMGGRLVLVSSGAIAAEFGAPGFDKRPTGGTDHQSCAAVGQGLLQNQVYRQLISKSQIAHDAVRFAICITGQYLTGSQQAAGGSLLCGQLRPQPFKILAQLNFFFCNHHQEFLAGFWKPLIALRAISITTPSAISTLTRFSEIAVILP